MSQPPYTNSLPNPPPNPEGRPLPPGWIQQYDYNYKAWYYVNTQENPPRSSWEHPHGPAPPSGPPPSHYAPPSSGPPATGDRGFNQSSGGYNPSYGDGYGGPPQQQGGYNHPQGYGGPDYQQSQQGFDSGPPPAQGSRGLFGQHTAPQGAPQKSGMGIGKMLALGGAAFLGTELIEHEWKEHNKKEREEGYERGYLQGEFDDRRW